MSAASTTAVPPANTIGRTLGLLGDEWSLLIVRHAFAGVRRFGGWKTELGISDTVLAARLTTLVDAQVLERREPATGVGHADYRLTPRGLELWPLLLSIWTWELHHVPGQASRLPRMAHADCGPFEPVLRCAGCHRPASASDVDARLGPSGDFGRSAPIGATRRRPANRRVGTDGAGLFVETMALIGNRWSSALLGAAFLGAARFSDFERALGAPPATVADRLRRFVDLDVLRQGSAVGTGAESQGRSTYHLSAKGQAFFPVVATALAWSERWSPDADGPAILATHRPCGGPFLPELGCSTCGDVLTRRTVLVRPRTIDTGR